MRVYLDACCLNRLTDDETQLRIFKRMRDGSIQWISSEVLVEEIDKNPAVGTAIGERSAPHARVRDNRRERPYRRQSPTTQDCRLYLSMRCTWPARKLREPTFCSRQTMDSSRKLPVALAPLRLPYAIRYTG